MFKKIGEITSELPQEQVGPHEASRIPDSLVNERPKPVTFTFRKRQFIFFIIVLLYAATWVGGWVTHDRELTARANLMYQIAAKRIQSEIAEFQKCEDKALVKEFVDSHTHMLDRNGPKAQVNWCVPILPGVLLSSTDVVLGPMKGGGDHNIVLFDGFRATVLFSWPTWRP